MVKDNKKKVKFAFTPDNEGFNQLAQLYCRNKELRKRERVREREKEIAKLKAIANRSITHLLP